MVAASREWICVRPASYESADEAEVLVRFFSGPKGTLQNTVFCLVEPDGKRQLTRGGRSARFVYSDAEALAEGLGEHLAKFKTKDRPRDLPTIADLRLGLNIASCDDLPLVVGVAKGARSQGKLREQLAEFAWGEACAGRAHYVILEEPGDLGEWEGYDPKAQIHVLAPEAYGRHGEVLASLASGDKDLEEAFRVALGSYQPLQKDDRRHVRQGSRAGIEWDAELPVTDEGGSGRRDR